MKQLETGFFPSHQGKRIQDHEVLMPINMEILRLRCGELPMQWSGPRVSTAFSFQRFFEEPCFKPPILLSSLYYRLPYSKILTTTFVRNSTATSSMADRPLEVHTAPTRTPRTNQARPPLLVLWQHCAPPAQPTSTSTDPHLLPPSSKPRLSHWAMMAPR
jgi:hypothetical protein